MDKITKAFSADVSVEDGERAVTAKISTSAVDRDGEVLIPMGCNTKDFEKNPVVFLNHDDWSTRPGGKCVGIKREERSITAKTVFAERPENHPAGDEWVPDTLLSLFKQGVLKGFSVGFSVVESRGATDKDLLDYGAACRRVYSKWKLLEYSVAPLPSNQEAIALAVSKGFISQATATKMFGVETPEVVTIEESRAIPEVEPKPSPILRVRKRIIIHGEPVKPAGPTNKVLIRMALAKSRGHMTLPRE